MMEVTSQRKTRRSWIKHPNPDGSVCVEVEAFCPKCGFDNGTLGTLMYNYEKAGEVWQT